MEAALALLPLHEPTTSANAPQPVVKPRSRRSWNWAFALLAVAVLVGALIGFSTPRLPRQEQRSDAGQRSQPAVIAAPSPDNANPIAVQPPSPQGVTITGSPAPAAASRESATSAQIREQQPVRREFPREAPVARSIRTTDPCGDDGADSAWCLRGDALHADDRLRDAYADAVRAGVDRDMLVGVRNDWARLRRRAISDPESMIRGYATLTEGLRAATSEARDR